MEYQVSKCPKPLWWLPLTYDDHSNNIELPGSQHMNKVSDMSVETVSCSGILCVC